MYSNIGIVCTQKAKFAHTESQNMHGHYHLRYCKGVFSFKTSNRRKGVWFADPRLQMNKKLTGPDSQHVLTIHVRDYL